jgi:Restriction endonuclease fold toxin 5
MLAAAVADRATSRPPRIGDDNGEPVCGSPLGRTFAFTAHYQAQAGAPLQALAKSYGTTPAALLATHPELWTLATQDHALNAGPPPPGRAMGDAQQLGRLDLYLADPQIAALIKAHGGTPAPASGHPAHEQLRLFGAERFAQLSRLGHAMESVRHQYSAALAQAQGAGSGPGWSQHTSTVTESGDFFGSSHTYQVNSSSFDPDAFTAWYIKQDGLANKAFASFYGNSHTTYSEGHNNVGGESGESSSRISIATLAFDNPSWALSAGGEMQHTALHGLNINDTPRLNNDAAVGFDLEAGWVTSPDNLHQGRDWFETVVVGALVGVVSYCTFSAAAPWLAGMGLGTTTATGGVVLTTGGAVVASGLAAGAASVASGAINGNLRFQDVLKGMLAGGLSAGLINQFGAAVQSSAGAAGTMALRTTVQGSIQALLGGKFKDGAIAGLASGLAELASTNMNQAVADKTMTAAEAFGARASARLIGSAIRALGNPNDPQYALASSFVSDLMPKEAAPTGPTTEQVRDLLGPDGSGTVTTDLQRPVNGGGAVAGGPPVPPPDHPQGPQEPQGPQDPTQQRIEPDGTIHQTIVVTGQRPPPLPQDEAGNRYELAAEGYVVVHSPDGALTRIEAQQAQAWGLSAELAAATARALPGAAGAGAGGALITRGLVFIGTAAPWTVAIGGLLSGDTERPLIVKFGDDTQYVQQPGQTSGQLQTFDPQTGELIDQQVRHGYTDNMGRFKVLTDEQLRNLQQPTATPGAPLPPLPPLPTPVDRPDPAAPGYEATPPVAGTPGRPAAPPVTLQDLIMQSRQRADDAWRANPNLRSPSSLNGTSEGGPGQWGYSPTRTGGEAYQEQVTGVPRGVEYNVNGVWFDGYDASRGVLVDSKDWVNYPPAEAEFWQSGVVKEANGQLDAAASTGARVEWQVSSQQAADALNELIGSTEELRGRITVVVVPKR